MKLVAGVDIGNSTTEVCIGRIRGGDIQFLSSATHATTGIKGTVDNIPGIGPKRKQELLKTFKSLTTISQAQLQELERILPKDAAMAVYRHYHPEEGKQ